MTDQSHNNRRPIEPGHRYEPRRGEGSREVVSRQSDVVQKAVQQMPAQSKSSPKLLRQRQVSAAKPAHPRQHRSLVLKRRGLSTPATTAASVPASVPVAATVAVEHESSAPRRHYSRFHPANTHPALVFVGAAVLAAVLVFGGGLLFFQSKKAAPDKYTLGSAPETLGATTSKPSNALDLSEVAPTGAEMAAYHTAPGSPRYLKIPKMQVSARVIAMDTGKDGLPGIPQNIYDAGWFARSAAPGTNGVMLINGQVAGNTKAGVFAALTSLAVGDALQVERGDGKTISYKVTKIDRYDPSKLTLDEALKPADSIKPGLNLLAANGRYDAKTNTFEKRFVIRAVQQ